MKKPGTRKWLPVIFVESAARWNDEKAEVWSDADLQRAADSEGGIDRMAELADKERFSDGGCGSNTDQVVEVK